MTVSAPAIGLRLRSSVLIFPLLMAGVVSLLIGLGIWQIERRAWKLALIDRVEHRVHAAPVAAPGPAAWSALTRGDAEYRHVAVTGRFVAGHDTRVSATTDLGIGAWVLTPFRDVAGYTVLVNRGFVPSGRQDSPPPNHLVTVSGLLRITEPGGAFLRANDPAHDRWYSRDVAAIAAAQAIPRPAPYFIDADATPDPRARDDWPRGGLTRIRFYNNHLVYALTWFGLAAAVAGATVVACRDMWRSRPDR
ncbi:MAG TPA: SURF1 family protein [Rhodopila sp.]|uniref:SURF1 family protein n=1 Tax=Rhodopila sp. TaxID=2480087 RepID=UPI002BF996AC|nr:SURF1 family protein [Rhodopila sp.]HVY13986.1 SURF1 family protein [Rhodopila sp.]